MSSPLSAFATQGGEGNNTNCNGQGNPNSPCQGTTNNGGAGGQGGAGGTGIGVGIGVGVAKANQHQSQAQGQAQQQGQAQGQGQSQSYEGSSSASISVSGTSFERYAPPVGAPALTSAGTGVCLGSVSIGLSGPMAGASFGITKVDRGCERRSGAALLYQMGYKDAAIRLLSNDDEIREALGIAAPAKAARTETPAVVQPASLQVQSN